MFSEGSLSHLLSLTLSSLFFALAASINSFLFLMYSLLPFRVLLFGPKWRPPLFILRRQKYFGQFNCREGYIKKCLSISTLLSSFCALIAHLAPVQLNFTPENFTRWDCSVEPETRYQQTRGAPISGRRRDLTLQFQCAIRQSMNYVIGLKAGGAWVAANQRNA